jgi:UDP-N-acetylglucosamine 1-carboxyvinyltransferase
MGVSISLDHGYVNAEAKRLQGCKIHFDTVSVTGTENLMMAAVLADGETVLSNAAREPEVAALADFLRSMGAHIEGDGSQVIRIQGVRELDGGDAEIIPDRIETGTYMAAVGMTAGNALIRNCRLSHMESVVSRLRQAGLVIEPEEDGARVVALRDVRATDVKTQPYPGFATDMQAQFMALMTLAHGTSVISETVFENRFMHVLELQRMGADIHVEGHAAIVHGKPFLSGAEVMATDLRASASLVLAGLAARGETVVHRIYHLDRGYEKMEQKFAALGANIRREREST